MPARMHERDKQGKTLLGPACPKVLAFGYLLPVPCPPTFVSTYSSVMPGSEDPNALKSRTQRVYRAPRRDQPGMGTGVHGSTQPESGSGRRQAVRDSRTPGIQEPGCGHGRISQPRSLGFRGTTATRPGPPTRRLSLSPAPYPASSRVLRSPPGAGALRQVSRTQQSGARSGPQCRHHGQQRGPQRLRVGLQRPAAHAAAQGDAR